MCTPLRISFPRPLVVLLPPPWPVRSWRTLGTASAPATITATTMPARTAPRRPHANTAARTTPAASAAKLDWEYEK
jgi:hypothetical protein